MTAFDSQEGPLRRTFSFHGCVTIRKTPQVADRIVTAAAGPMAWQDDPLLRRFWRASFPSDVLYLRSHKRDHERTKQRPQERQQARQLVAA